MEVGCPIFKCGHTLYYSWVPLEVSSDGNDTKDPSLSILMRIVFEKGKGRKSSGETRL